MNPLPQTAPISDMRQRQDEILGMAQDGPVMLMSRSKPAGVLVSPTQWNAIAGELHQYRAREVAAMRSREIDLDPSLLIPFTDAELISRGVLNG